MNWKIDNTRRNIIRGLFGLGVAIAFAGCGVQSTIEYEAKAVTIMTWRVNYTNDPMEDKRGRYEEFESVSLENRNGEKPAGALNTPDDKGLYWAKVPPKPTVDEVEARKKRNYEEMGKPELLREVKYYITYEQNGQTITLPTNHGVYRQVAKAYPNKTPLKLTMGLNNGSVEKAEPAI